MCVQHCRGRFSPGASFPARPPCTAVSEAADRGGKRTVHHKHPNPEHVLGRGAPWASRRICTVVSGIPAASWCWPFPCTPGSHLCDTVLNSHLPVRDVLPRPPSKPHGRQDWMSTGPVAPGPKAHTTGHLRHTPQNTQSLRLSVFTECMMLKSQSLGK